jgi:hypothetical protein
MASSKISNRNRYVALFLSLTLITTAGCGGVSSKRWKQIGTVIAVGIAAKLIYDMVVDYQSKQVNDEDEVVNNYMKTHNKLPSEPQLISYESKLMPGTVVTAGNSISVESKLEVVRGESTRTVDIQEKITIFDNEDPDKELKSLVKTVNDKTKASGSFENQFTFKLPKGMPQGIYPVKTTVIVDGKEQTPVNSEMQLVWIPNQRNAGELVAAN